MQTDCPHCSQSVDLFNSWIIGKNAYPERKPDIQVLCPKCGDIFPSTYKKTLNTCRTCGYSFSPRIGVANRAKATCPNCVESFSIIKAVGATGRKPRFRLFGKLVLTKEMRKEYLPVTKLDLELYNKCSAQLKRAIKAKKILLPELYLDVGHNTGQAMRYGFRTWRDFFNDRQLLALGLLQKAISELDDTHARDSLLTLFSGCLEFNNMFASYKGEGTGAVRHMFAHHILKPERMPLEANLWGTSKSSGSFSNLFHRRILKAADYHNKPTEINGSSSGSGIVCSKPFSGRAKVGMPKDITSDRSIYLACGDSSVSGLAKESVDLVVTDPPFFDNVHYSELADFFFSWQQLVPRGFIENRGSTRSKSEVQDSSSVDFARKLCAVFTECHRVLRDDGLMVFTYHHSRDEGWQSVAEAVIRSGFTVVNSHPVKSEMSGATPKSQAKEPIQFDMIIVCRKYVSSRSNAPSINQALEVAKKKLGRIESAGFSISCNDKKVIVHGQLLTTLREIEEIQSIGDIAQHFISD